ncbi:MAG TPA: hypothetical protein PLP61_01875 [Nocardioides sp.]|uniref:hypothetical protein n=1 Tax=Nocardioides sp. TaxID=35761 RepID=UPI002CF1CA40|nr:hypothetical protein [Nocardioides sp.]HQR25761.1 hypothetical protein [Nocardioides sp.]
MDQGAPTVGESCPDCHAFVADLAAHKHWHSQLVAHIATAVEEEIKRLSGAGG